MTLDKYIHTPRKEEPGNTRLKTARDLAIITITGMGIAYGVGKLDTHLNDPDRKQIESPIEEKYEATDQKAIQYEHPSLKGWEIKNSILENYKS